MRQLRVIVAGQRAFGAAALGVVLERDGVDVVGAFAPMGDPLADAADAAGVRCAPDFSAWWPLHRVDLILAAHSHQFIGRRTRQLTTLGAVLR